jgi:hypothetical protein
MNNDYAIGNLSGYIAILAHQKKSVPSMVSFFMTKRQKVIVKDGLIIYLRIFNKISKYETNTFAD